MARKPVSALQDVGILGVDSILFLAEQANDRAEAGRANGLDDADAHAADAAVGLGIAGTAPEGVPAEPGLPDAVPPAAGPDAPLGAGDLTLMAPSLLGAKGGEKGPPGGGGGGGGGSDGGTTLLSSYTSGDPNVADSAEYNIEIIFKGSWTEALQQAFIDAAEYLSDVILDDIADVFFRGKVIDDIRIDAKLTTIDGEGGILGQAGPTAYRTANFLPATAVMEFDSADAAYFDSLGLFDDIVLHEMMHSIGFGTMWDLMGLTEGSIEADSLVFIGANATDVYGAPVPVETDYGSGTAGGHWDEETFLNELMTGFIDDANYLSNMTIAALEDMGYDTVWNDLTSGSDGTGAIPPDPVNDALIA
jgi:hypothetical protein